MFSKKNQVLLAVADGSVLPLAEVADEAFASGMLGQGIAIEPREGTVYSPIDGTVDSVTDTGHAYSICTEDGLDVLVHVGIDTVEMKGDGFLPMVKIGDRVKAGDVLLRADLDKIRAAGHPVTIPVLITNPERLRSFSCKGGADVIGGKSTVIEYRV